MIVNVNGSVLHIKHRSENDISDRARDHVKRETFARLHHVRDCVELRNVIEKEECGKEYSDLKNTRRPEDSFLKFCSLLNFVND
jgi:hypothetical protein